MNRRSATRARHHAADVSDPVAPHLASAKATLSDEVLPKVRDDVLPKVREGVKAGLEGVKEGVHAGMDATKPARKRLKKRGKAAGEAAAEHLANVRENYEFDPLPKRKKKGSKVRKVAVLAVIGGAAYAAYSAWKLPHDSDDWVYADSVPPPRSGAEGVPSDAAPAATTARDL